MGKFKKYEASAGAGKTYTLVRSYLEIILSSNDPTAFKHVLALTFTKKAAAEMKDRILKILAELAGIEPISKSGKSMRKELCAAVRIDENTVAQKAEKIFKSILHNYSDFSVGTIDSFMYRITKAYARELGLPAKFEVETDMDYVKDRAVQIMLMELKTNNPLKKFLIRFVEAQLDDNKSWKVEDKLLEFANEVFKTHLTFYYDKLKKLNLKDFERIDRELYAFISKFENELITLAEEAIEVIDNAGVKKEWLYGGGAIYKYLEKITTGDFKMPGARVKDALEKWYSGKADDFAKDRIENIENDLKFAIDTICWYLKKLDEYNLKKEIGKNLFRMALLREFKRILDNLKEENNIVFISDFTSHIQRVVNEEPVPFIYEKVGERYSHLLFDEFQDTSILQWHNMLPLVEESLSKNGTAMVVGDGKQSIYRWRGGEVEQFTELPKYHETYQIKKVKDSYGTIERSFVEVPKLEFNYRSSANIVRFNNEFFNRVREHLTDNALVGKIYKNVSQKLAGGNEDKGYVEFRFYHEKADENRERIKEETVELVNRLINEEGYKPGDIAILTMKNNTGIPIVEGLGKNGVPVSSAESLLVNYSPRVRLVMAYLNHLLHPDDKYYMSITLIYLAAVNDEIDVNRSLHDISMQKDCDESYFIKVLGNNGITVNPAALRKLPLYELVVSVIELFGMVRAGDERLMAFLDFVHSVANSRHNGLMDFVHLWDMKKDNLAIDASGNRDAVTVTTVHKAKGLEWPVVIIAEANREIKHNQHRIWVKLPENYISRLEYAIVGANKTLESNEMVGEQIKKEFDKLVLDGLNTLYVAMTRPAERLYAFVSMGDRGSNKLFDKLKGVFDKLEIKPLRRIEEELVRGKKTVLELTLLSYGREEKPNQTKVEEMPDTIEIVPNRNSNYQDKLLIRRTPPRIGKEDGKRLWGNVLHNILAEIRDKSEAGEVLDRFASLGIITGDNRNQIGQMLEALFTSAVIAPFFDRNNHVLIEQEILLPKGEFIRPDRVLIDGDSAVVIDFKTGVKKDAHIKQVSDYKYWLEQMGHRTTGYIIYLDREPEIVEV